MSAAELVGPKYRTLYGVGYHTAFSVGFMLVAAMAYAIRDDRLLQLVMQVPNVAFLGYFW